MTKEQMEVHINETLQNWFNAVTLTDDGWTALHLACSSNNDLFIFMAENLNMNLATKNKNGVNLMHKAAMDDNSYLVTYLRDKARFKIDEEDSNGNTPLHYACYHASEYASFWLMGFGHNVNCQNKNGDTPMHLLIKSKKDMYSTKTVRELIFKGANRDIKNT